MAHSTHRAKRMSNSLGESWGDAEYQNDTDGSVVSLSDHSASDGDENDHGHLPPRQTNGRTVSLSPRDSRRDSASPQTPVRSFRSSTQAKASPLSKSATHSPNVSFIMPESAEPSPLRKSQLNHRRIKRQTSASNPQPSRQHDKILETDDQGPEDQPWHYVHLFWWHFLRPVISYVISVLGFSLNIIRPMLGYAMVFVLTFWLLSRTSDMIKIGVSNALSPICVIPGSSYLIPFCASTDDATGGDVEFEGLMRVQSTFEDVLQSSLDASTLPLDMKRSEASIRDLRIMVQHSKLPSRSELEVEFSYFIEAAKDTSTRLTKFNSRIGRGLDVILSTNRWTIQILDGMKEKQDEMGLFSRLNPLNGFRVPITIHEKVFGQYTRHTEAIDEQIKGLIAEAQALLAVLDDLDRRLETIAMIAVRDGFVTEGNREELLKRLWTRLGGNKTDIRKLNNQIALLNSVTLYKKQAWNHVSATLLKLQEISAGLEDLRERVATPGNLGYQKEVPLDFHLENIRLGVERLEGVRSQTRNAQLEGHRRILERLDDDHRALPGSSGDMDTIYARPKAQI